MHRLVKKHKSISYARSFWQYVCHDDIREHLRELSGGCLYLPGNAHVNRFFQKVEGANHWHFINMLESSFFPLNGTQCPTDERGKTVTTSEGQEVKTCKEGSGFVGSKGDCIHARLLEHTAANASNLKVYVLDGMMGLDPIWQHLMSAAGDDAEPRESLVAERTTGPDDARKKKKKGNKKTFRIPIKFYVCDSGDGTVSRSVSDKMLEAQLKVLNEGFGGSGVCKGNNAYTPTAKDTKLRFKSRGISFLTSKLCAHDCADNIDKLTKEVVPREDGMVKVLVCQTDLLGIASFPGDPDGRRILIVNSGTLPGGDVSNYNEGDTLTHEMGHYLGLYHTFQGGCSYGDQVADTNMEETPYFGCPTAQPPLSCSNTLRPVHNFMDYSDDRCMCSFTTGQTRRMIAQLKAFQPDLV